MSFLSLIMQESLPNPLQSIDQRIKNKLCSLELNFLLHFLFYLFPEFGVSLLKQLFMLKILNIYGQRTVIFMQTLHLKFISLVLLQGYMNEKFLSFQFL